MKALFWNVRGFGARGHRDQLKDVLRGDNIDLVGLVETFKTSFSPNELAALRELIDLTGTFSLPLATRAAFYLVVNVMCVMYCIGMWVYFRLRLLLIIVPLVYHG